MLFGLFNRRDPWWEADGPAARRHRRRVRVTSMAAFTASVAAISGAAYMWALHLGLAGGFGLGLPIG
jgi:hypothetical protein